MLVFSWFANLLYAQESTLFYARTLSIDQAQVVQLASVYNVNSGVRKISNRSGYFAMMARTNDTLVITAIGYDSLKFVITSLNNDTSLVWMRPKSIRLKEVKIVAANPKRDSLARAAAEFLKNDPLMNDYSRILNRPKGSLLSPLTALYEQFSKEGRDAARFEEFVAYMEKQKQVDRIYNRNLVRRATTIPELKIDEFMVYCRLDKDFVLRATAYELVEAIQQCERNFNQRVK